MIGRHMLGAGGVIVLLALSSPTLASEVPEAPVFIEVPPVEAQQPALELLSNEDLAQDTGRGGVAVSLTEQDLTAVNTGNQINADNVGSGAINMSDAALAGFNGIGNFTFNTGHNNNLQSSLSVTVIVTP